MIKSFVSPLKFCFFYVPIDTEEEQEGILQFTVVPNLLTPSTTTHKQCLVSKHNGICVICNFLLIIRLGQGSPWGLMPHKTFIALLQGSIIYQYQLPNCSKVDNKGLFFSTWLLLMSITPFLKEVIAFK